MPPFLSESTRPTKMLEAYPLAVAFEAAQVDDAQRRRIFRVQDILHAVNFEPVRSLTLAAENFNGIGARFVFYLPPREREAAMRAFADAQHDDFPAGRAHLGRCLTILAVVLDLDANIIDRAEASDIAGEIKDQTVLLAVGLASTAADLLHVEAGRAGRAQHRNQIDVRNVEAVAQHHDRDQ